MLAELKSFLKDLVVPFRGLMVALAGVGLAWLWFNNRQWPAVVATVVLICLGKLFELLGRLQLPDNPVWALRLMELWVISPTMFAAASAAAIVVTAVHLSLPETAPMVDKKLIGALGAGITAFLSGGFVSWAADQKDSTADDRIKRYFQDKYKRHAIGQHHVVGVSYFRADSAGERWVYSDEYGGVSGWGKSARLKRAKGIAAELASGRSAP
jgi:hypothetical protein